MLDRRKFMTGSVAAGLLQSPNLFARSRNSEQRIHLKKNIVFINLDLGLYGKNFRDGGASSKYMTEVFSEFKGKMTYFDGISEPGMGGGHECQHATFTALKYEDREHYPEKTMMSIDQIIAQGSVQETRHKMIYHTINPGANNMSWNQFEQPLLPVDGANNLYEMLFSRTDNDLAKARIRRERDILSTLARNFRRYWRGFKQEEDMRESVEYQLSVLDEREKWLKVRKPYLKKAFGEKDQETPIPSSSNNFNLIYNALEKQQTKLVLIQYGANRLNRGIGVELGHHGNTHNGGYSERIEGLEKIDMGVLTQVKNFLHKLQEGELYDDTIVLFYCGMGDAGRHDNKRAPAFLFGGGFEHKESITCLNDKNEHIYSTSNMFSTVMKQAGFNDVTFQRQEKVVNELFKV